MLRTLLTYILWTVMVLLVAPIAVLCALLPASLRYDNRFYFWACNKWNKLFFRVAGIRVQVMSSPPARGDGNGAIYVMNHSSALDIPLIEVLLGAQPRIWLSKVEYKHVPLFSFILRRFHVFVDLTSTRTAARSLYQARALAMGTNRHILIFPEGGRFIDGKIHDFFGGFVWLSKKLDRPIIPVYIHNAHRVLSPIGYQIDNRHQLEMRVGEPIWRMAGESDSDLSARVREWFIAENKK